VGQISSYVHLERSVYLSLFVIELYSPLELYLINDEMIAIFRKKKDAKSLNKRV
jgi:hypothetical protein